MRTMAKAVFLLLAVAFVAGLWDARYGEEDGPFRTGPVERDRQSRPAAELVSVEAVEGEGYDRVLFTFQGPMPGYQVRYVPEVTDQAGRRLSLRGQASVAVAFEPARAHEPDGQATFTTGGIDPDGPALRQVRFAGDFEGRVLFGIGVADRGGFRVTELRNPARVAIDVR